MEKVDDGDGDDDDGDVENKGGVIIIIIPRELVYSSSECESWSQAA